MKHYFFPQMIELQLIGPELTLRMLIEAWCSLQVIELEFKGLDPVARMLFHACHDARFLTTWMLHPRQPAGTEAQVATAPVSPEHRLRISIARETLQTRLLACMKSRKARGYCMLI